MDFKRVLSLLLEKFSNLNIRYALMGGFAMGLPGVGRTTIDPGFLVYQPQYAALPSHAHPGHAAVGKTGIVTGYLRGRLKPAPGGNLRRGCVDCVHRRMLSVERARLTGKLRNRYTVSAPIV